MEAKMILRKYILHNQNTQAVRVLLKSNMWLPNIFPSEALEEAGKTKKYSSLKYILNLNDDGSLRKDHSDYSKKNNHRNSHQKRHYEDSIASKRVQSHQKGRDFNNSYTPKDSFHSPRSTNEPNQNKPSKPHFPNPSGKQHPKGRGSRGRGKPRK